MGSSKGVKWCLDDFTPGHLRGENKPPYNPYQLGFTPGRGGEVRPGRAEAGWMPVGRSDFTLAGSRHLEVSRDPETESPNKRLHAESP